MGILDFFRLKWKHFNSTIRPKRDIGPLVAALNDSNSSIVEAAIEDLVDCGDAAVVPLIQALDRHERASEVLVRLGKRSVKPLLYVLAHRDYYVGERAADVLSELADPEAVYPLLLVVAQKERAAVDAAIEEIGISHDPEVSHLQDGMGSQEDAFDVDVAAEKLAKSRDFGAAYTALLGDWVVSMGQSARARDQARRAIFRTGEAAIPPLIEALRVTDGNVQRKAEDRLSDILDGGNVDANHWHAKFVELLGDAASNVRAIAAHALGAMQYRPALHSLIEVLGDESSKVRAEAAWALGTFGDPQAVSALIESLSDKDYDFLIKAAEALGKLGDERAVEALVPLLTEGARDAAAAALAKFGDERAIEPLVQRLTRDGCLYAGDWGIEALRKFGRAAVKPLVRALDSESVRSYNRHHVVQLLGELGDRSATTALVKLLSQKGDLSTETREAAAKALERLWGSNWRDQLSSGKG
ncbi:MAG: HEAT repeat domain-containing protein [Phycisphaerae bacterium]|nr:HEAT repeat domain-containing protein [Phycisphaerae bacterium]